MSSPRFQDPPASSPEDEGPHLARETPDFVSLADVSIRCSEGGGAGGEGDSSGAQRHHVLHAHSQVLARSSAVAGALVASLHEAGSPPSCSKPLDISHLFEDSDLAVVSLLLQCFYGVAPHQALFDGADPARLQALLRLAHKLDARGVIQRLQKYLREDRNDCVTRDTLGWLRTAESLQLDELRCAVLCLLVWQLAQRPATVVTVMKDPAWLSLERSSLLLVLDALTARPDWGLPISSRDIEQWGGPGTFTAQAVLRRQQEGSQATTADAGGAAGAAAALAELEQAEDEQLQQAAADWDAAFDAMADLGVGEGWGPDAPW